MKKILLNPIYLIERVYYPDSCEEELDTHNCDPCEETEFGRIRFHGYIKKGFTFSDPTSPTEWQQAVADGNVIIIPKSNGSFDGGSPKEGPGYGDQETTNLGSAYVANVKDPNYASNYSFYNTLKRSRNWKFFYGTSSKIHITNVACSVFPKNPVADDINSVVEWDVQIKWSDSNLPKPYDIPEGIFDNCFIQD